MQTFRRTLGVIGAAVFTVAAVAMIGSVSRFDMIAPMTLVNVLGLTLILALLVYTPSQLKSELAKAFSGHKNHPIDRRMLNQLAVFSLAAGLLLAVSEVLMRLRPLSGLPELSALTLMQAPFMSLLYAVLAAVGLWVVGHGHNAERRNEADDSRAVALTSGLLLLAVMVVGYLLIGMSRQVPLPTELQVSNTTLSSAETADVAEFSAMQDEPTGPEELGPDHDRASASHQNWTLAMLRWETDIQCPQHAQK